jgi:hypothetical protein
MNPEIATPHPEKETETPYLTAAEEVMRQAELNVAGTTARFSVIDGYLEDILKAADNRDIAGSTGSVYTRDMLMVRLDQLLAEERVPVEKRSETDPYKLIPRAGGLRDAVKLLMSDEATYRDFEASIKLQLEAKRQRHAELLSDQEIRDMGEVEVGAAGVEEPLPGSVAEASHAARGIITGIPDAIKAPTTEPLNVAEVPKLTAVEYLEKLTDGFSDKDKSALRDYAEAVAEKRDAQKNGENDRSIYFEQQKGQSYKALSSEARAIAERYAHAYNHYE